MISALLTMWNNYMKNEKFKLVITGLLITLGICVLIYVANNCIPEHLKLDAGIWGTVDSWMVYLVTLVTAVFIYKTLESQQRTLDLQRTVQEDQSVIKGIELSRYRNSILPNLTIIENKIDYIESDELYDVDFDVEFGENQIKWLEISSYIEMDISTREGVLGYKHSGKKRHEKIYEYKIDEDLFGSDNINIRLKLKQNYDLRDGVLGLAMQNIEFRYADKGDNIITQRVKLIQASRKTLEIIPYSPKYLVPIPKH